MKQRLLSFFCLMLLCMLQAAQAQDIQTLINRGWQALATDNDTLALQLFEQAYEKAVAGKNTKLTADALLNMGICTYSSSYSNGLQYCHRAMALYEKLAGTSPQEALQGRSRCLQLISTIDSRQGKYREAISNSTEALKGFAAAADSSGTRGLILASLAGNYRQLRMNDSAAYFGQLSLHEHELAHNLVYLPGAYTSAGNAALGQGDALSSKRYYMLALHLADSTGNRQARVSALLGLGKWSLQAGNSAAAKDYYLQAKATAQTLSDKAFYLKTLEQLAALSEQQGNYKEAYRYEQEMRNLRDTLYTWEKQRLQKNVEVQFSVAEKDRQVALMRKEKDIAELTAYLLWGSMGFLVALFAVIVLFLNRINRRNRQLIETREALARADEAQKQLKEKQLQNEIEFRESQLGALTLQMLQKNELIREFQERIGQDQALAKDAGLGKVISKGLNQDKEWSDFNASFESVNKNFYTRLRSAYPDISPNDLKICALIKMNLSIKEMAGILNISPDSVKTARYRLRKKLGLNTEDNLTDFILQL